MDTWTLRVMGNLTTSSRMTNLTAMAMELTMAAVAMAGVAMNLYEPYRASGV